MVQFSKSSSPTFQFALVHVPALRRPKEVVSVVVHHRATVMVVVADHARSHVPYLLSLALALVPGVRVRVLGLQDPFLPVLVLGLGVVRGHPYLHVDAVTMVVGGKTRTVAVAEEAGGDEDHRHAIVIEIGTIVDLVHHSLLPVVATHHAAGPQATLVVDLVV